MNGREKRWYGWGHTDVTYSLANRPHAWPYLESNLEVGRSASFPPVSLESVKLRPSRLGPDVLAELAALLGADAVATDDRIRLTHSLGQSYRDLMSLRRGSVANPTDAVLFPDSDEKIQPMLALAAANQLAVVPFGGGTSVVGGVEPMGSRPTLTLSLARLNRVLAIDSTSHTVTAQAGILGPGLEAALNEQGFTLGHFPQSFEFSTLGGWIATRSAGQASTKYGPISERVISLRVVTPAGLIDTRTVPANATGPSLLQLLIGSEGTYGVITRATLRLAPRPTVHVGHAVLFPDFDRGMAAVKRMIQEDRMPAVVRLSDETETRTSFALREARRGWPELRQRLGLSALARAGLSFDHGALLILRFEGGDALTQAETARALALCRANGGYDLGGSLARAWQRDRFHTPYLRDVLLDAGLLLDVVETATEWDNLANLHRELRSAITDAIAATGSKAIVMTHLSHAYSDGASLYVTFLARRDREREMEQWQMIKNAAMDCIMRLGGTTSHHHGVGYEHAAWLSMEAGPAGMEALHGVKRALDPDSIMNPGKLIPDSEADSRARN